jgi:hypothetical protein
MTAATDADIRDIRTAVESIAKATEANTKAIADLTTSMTGLREEMRVGFSDLKGQINTVEAKLEGKIDKLDERTRLGFWGFVGRGLVLAILIALIPFVTRYLTSSLPEIFHLDR